MKLLNICSITIRFINFIDMSKKNLSIARYNAKKRIACIASSALDGASTSSLSPVQGDNTSDEVSTSTVLPVQGDNTNVLDSREGDVESVATGKKTSNPFLKGIRTNKSSAFIVNELKVEKRGLITYIQYHGVQ